MSAYKVIGNGIDIVENERMFEMLAKWDGKFKDKVFLPGEQAYCESKAVPERHYAGRFAVKEAVLKVIGTGWRDGIAWTDIEVRNQPSGQPIAHLHGKCKEIAESQGIVKILISISHIQTHAIASAIGLSSLQGSE